MWQRHRGLQEIQKVYPGQIIINQFHEFIRNISIKIKLLSKNEKMSKKKNSVKMNHFDHKFLAWTFQNFLLCNKKWFIFLTLKWNFENHITSPNKQIVYYIFFSGKKNLLMKWINFMEYFWFKWNLDKKTFFEIFLYENAFKKSFYFR